MRSNSANSQQIAMRGRLAGGVAWVAAVGLLAWATKRSHGGVPHPCDRRFIFCDAIYQRRNSMSKASKAKRPTAAQRRKQLAIIKPVTKTEPPPSKPGKKKKGKILDEASLDPAERARRKAQRELRVSLLHALPAGHAA